MTAWRNRPRAFREWRIFARVTLTIALLALLIKRVALDRLLVRLDRHSPPGPPDPSPLRDAVRFADGLLRRLDRFHCFARRRCLLRSLALYSIARRCGCPATIHCGVQRNGDQLGGHAWLTSDRFDFGEVPPPGAYAVTLVHPRASRATTDPAAAMPDSSCCAMPARRP
jgi:hypothetical protein